MKGLFLDYSIIYLIILLIIPGCSLFNQERETIKIAVIINMSGSGSHMKPTKDGIDLAVNEINSTGGINGYPVEIIYRDNKSSPPEAVKQFNILEKEHRPILYISSSSACSTALAEHVDKNRVVVIGLMTSSDEFPKLSKWVIRYYFTAKDEAKSAMKFVKILKIKKIGFLYQDDEFGRSIHEAFIKHESSGKLKILSESFNSKSSLLTNHIKILLRTEALYLVSFSKLYKKLLPAIRRLKYKGDIICQSGASSDFIVKMPEADNVYVTAPLIYNPHYFFAKEFSKSLKKHFNRKVSHYNGIGYDIIILIKNLMTGREITRANVQKRLTSGFIHPGIFGDIKTEKGSNDISLPLYPARIKDGKLHYLK